MTQWLTRAIITVGCITLAFACNDDVEPISSIFDENTPPERTKSNALAVDESSIQTVYDATGATVSLEIETLAGIGSTISLEAQITGLEDEIGPKGSTSVVLVGGKQTISVAIPGAVAPQTQGEQAGMLVRYRTTGSDDDVFGMRSLFHTLPKYGMRLWAPSQMDAGTESTVRVFVRDLATGDLMPSVNVTIAGSTVTTDVAGQASFLITAPGEDATELQLVAEANIKGAPVTVSRKIAVVPAGAPRLFVSTDKPLYRPGQTMHIRALALAQKDLGPLGSVPVTLEVLDGKDNKIFKEETLTDEFGIAALTAPLASQVNLGDYTVRAVMEDVTYARTVKVSEEKLPKFAVKIQFDEPYFLPNTEVTGVLSARYFFGKPVADAAVTLVSLTGGEQFTGTTNAEGLLPFTLQSQWGASLPIEVTVTDSAGFSVSAGASTPILTPTLTVEVHPETTTPLAGEPTRLYVLTRDALGAPVVATCSVGGTSFTTGEGGLAVVDVAEADGMVGCSTAAGLSGKGYVAMSGPRADGGLRIRANQAIYGPGETLSLSLLAQNAGGTVYVDRVHRGRIVGTAAVELDEAGKGTLEMTTGKDESGLLVITAYSITEADVLLSAERLVYVRKSAAKVTVSTDQTTYLPGGQAKLTFEVTDEAGKGKAAAIGVTIADEAVFALAGSVGPNDVAGHFLLDDAPSSIHPYALGTPQGDAQDLATVGLLGLGPQNPTQGLGVTAASLQNDALKAYKSPLKNHLKAIRTTVQESANEGKLNEANAESRLSNIQEYDFWGQPIALDYETHRGGWYSYIQVTLTSQGPDELPDTPDDYDYSFSVEVTQRASEGGASMGADAASRPAPPQDGGWDNTDGTDSTDWESEPDGTDGGSKEPKKRTEFPETLYVNPALITDGSGKAEVTLQMADAITEWRVSMIANTASGLVGGGLGAITVFQDFFVDADLPRKLTQNDKLQLPIGVFNFSDTDQTVEVSVTAAEWFSLDGAASQTVTVPAGKSMAVPFGVTVLTAGHHNLEIAAKSATFTDGVIRTVQVMPDGQRVQLSKSGPLEGIVNGMAVFPAEGIEGGNDGLLKIMGGPSAQMIDGVEALLGAPRGCFEPMMNSTWINALVLDYLAWTGQENASLTTMAKANLSDGVQQCLTFECGGGGFTWFGDPDPAHPILTAFALVMFKDIQSVDAPVDEGMVKRAQDWLAGEQDLTGCWFTTEGTKNQALPWDQLRTTCVALWGLSSSGYEDADVLGKAVTYVKDAMDAEVDTYTLAMCANALLEAAPEDTDTDSLVADLMGRALSAPGGLTYWDSDFPGITFASGDVIQVETTALVAQALYKLPEPPPSVEGALKFLAGKKSPDGNFLSTQGTIQALRAFVAAAKFGSKDTKVDVEVKVGNKTVFAATIDKSNKEVVHLISLSEFVGENADLPVTITTAGEGKLYYQLASQHYLKWDPATRAVGKLADIDVNYSATTLNVGESTLATIIITSLGGGAGPGDMPMVDFGVPPGFDADLSQLDTLVATDPLVARYEVKGERVVIYLHDIPKEAGKKAFEVGIPLSPRYPMTVTTLAARTWPFYEPQNGSESVPVVLTVN